MSGIAVSLQDKITFPLRVIFTMTSLKAARRGTFMFMNGTRKFFPLRRRGHQRMLQNHPDSIFKQEGDSCDPLALVRFVRR